MSRGFRFKRTGFHGRDTVYGIRGAVLTDEESFARCPATGKHRHPSRSKAKRHAKHLKGAGDAGVKAYCCRHCAGWHVGHPKKETV